MSYEEMKKTITLIDTTEEFIMRPLTEKEKRIFIDKGIEYFYKEVLNFTEEKFKEFKHLRQLISTYYTKNKSSFNQFYRDKNHTDALVGLTKLMENINWNFVDSQDCIQHFTLNEEKPTEVSREVAKVIDDLYAGKEVGPYDDDYINAIVDYLWENNDNLHIEVKNGKMKVIKPVKK